MKSVTVRVRERLRLQCAVKPGKVDRTGLTLIWYKDGVRLERRRVKINNKKGRLAIPSVRLEDAGEYVCRAERGKSRCAEAKATVQVTPEEDPPSTPPLGSSSLCPIHSYCLNGGSCLFYEAIQEMSCMCAEGYKGQRCDLKDVSNSGNEDKDSWP